MKTLAYVFSALVMMGMFGCDPRILAPDLTPPSIPQGLATAAGDEQVVLSWYPSPENDVAGYSVYSSSSYGGKYILIGTTNRTDFVDDRIQNGITYYYAVTSYDVHGNESELSADVAYETPRPEGYDVVLKDYRVVPVSAGYDFSTNSVGQYDDQYTDAFFEYYNGVYYLDVWDDTNIQDLGYTNSLYEIRTAPTSGWSPTKDVQLISGHTYVIETWDHHYAKVRVTAISQTRIVFDWAYQLQEGNPQLKRGVTRGMLKPGDGLTSRQ